MLTDRQSAMFRPGDTVRPVCWAAVADRRFDLSEKAASRPPVYLKNCRCVAQQVKFAQKSCIRAWRCKCTRTCEVEHAGLARFAAEVHSQLRPTLRRDAVQYSAACVHLSSFREVVQCGRECKSGEQRNFIHECTYRGGLLKVSQCYEACWLSHL